MPAQRMTLAPCLVMATITTRTLCNVGSLMLFSSCNLFEFRRAVAQDFYQHQRQIIHFCAAQLNVAHDALFVGNFFDKSAVCQQFFSCEQVDDVIEQRL